MPSGVSRLEPVLQTSSVETEMENRMRLRKYLRWVAWTIGILLLIFLLGDFGYSRYVATKLNRWEQTVERDEAGVMKGCQAYTLEPPEPNGTALLLVHGINDLSLIHI